MNTKTKKLIEDCERENIPIFVLSAKDICSVFAIRQYRQTCVNHVCGDNHLNGVTDRINEFEKWQLENKTKTKIPDESEYPKLSQPKESGL